ncbi:peptidase domain-containing ABC transporter [Pontibacter ruber]|uniref:Peptidase domain-containing ABC transporter n=1 Tax=Pontibacter ruber TaxID=1343895 RepID=A0ABW5CSE0_9BACT|nr:peptidase domain-containing ABC transporter [Pontibacter ruber]
MSIKIKQRDLTDCGAACLSSVANYYKLKLPVSKIRQMASTDQKGTNVLGLVEAAQKMGFSAKGVRGEFESLFKIPTPTIAHVIIKGVLHHYVVIYKVTKKHIHLMDPADGHIHKMSHEEFKSLWSGVLVLLMPNEDFKAFNQTVSVYQRFWFLIKPHKSVMLQALVGAVIYTVLGLSTAIYVQKIVDNVFGDGNKNLLNLMSVIMLLLLAFQVLIGLYKALFVLKTGQKIDSRLILGYYKHLLTLPQQFFDTMRVGEIISRINDAVKIRTFINDVSINLMVNVFIVLFAFALMFTYYWKLALVILLIIPFYTLVYFITNKLNRKAERQLMEDSAELESQLVESITAAGTIKRFGMEDHANMKSEVRFVKLLGSVYKSSINNISISTTSETISKVFTIVLLWIGAGYVLDNLITPGELMSFYAVIGYFTGPISTLIGMNKTIQNAMIAADRLFEIMDLEVESNEHKFELKKELIGDIYLKDIYFRYGSRKSVFEGLTLTIPKGKITGIIGESGSGKSTLISILQNLYPLQSGSVHIGDYDLKYIENKSLRQFVTVVPQKVDLFAGNVIENIALNDYQPDIQRIVSICGQLGMMEFIEGLPNGFATYLGENGASLSGGQKQRIAIARALYKNPEVLIMDEATSSLDPKSEEFVQITIRKLTEAGKSVIFITHRLAAVKDFDLLFVLENGKLIEQGTHSELLIKRERYFEMLNKQLIILN